MHFMIGLLLGVAASTGIVSVIVDCGLLSRVSKEIVVIEKKYVTETNSVFEMVVMTNYITNLRDHNVTIIHTNVKTTTNIQNVIPNVVIPDSKPQGLGGARPAPGRIIVRPPDKHH